MGVPRQIFKYRSEPAKRKIWGCPLMGPVRSRPNGHHGATRPRTAVNGACMGGGARATYLRRLHRLLRPIQLGTACTQPNFSSTKHKSTLIEIASLYSRAISQGVLTTSTQLM